MYVIVPFGTLTLAPAFLWSIRISPLMMRFLNPTAGRVFWVDPSLKVIPLVPWMERGINYPSYVMLMEPASKVSVPVLVIVTGKQIGRAHV